MIDQEFGTLTADDMQTVVFTSIDIDCDGIGEAFQRVSIPAYLAESYDHMNGKRRHMVEELASLRSIKSFHTAIENGTYDSLLSQIARTEKSLGILHGKCDGIDYAIRAYLRVADKEMSGYGDWWLLSRADQMELEATLQAEGGFDLDYWNENGYHSVFHSR